MLRNKLMSRMPDYGHNSQTPPGNRPVRVLFGALVCATISLANAEVTNGRTWHILNDGSGDAPTIQAGVDSGGMGDTVLVGPGTYYENIDSLQGGVVLISEFGPESTIIDGNQQGSVIHVTDDAEIKGFTIQNGLNNLGGGVRID